MKDYKEMADSVFQKIDFYEKNQKRRRANLIKLTSALSVLALFISSSIVMRLYLQDKEKRLHAEYCAIDGKCIDDSLMIERMVSALNGQDLVEEKAVSVEGKSFQRNLAKGEEASEKAEGAVSESALMETSKEGAMTFKSHEEPAIILNEGGDWINKCSVPTEAVIFHKEDMVHLDKEGLNAYFKRNIFPTVPEGLEEWEVPSYQVFRKDGGKGDVYYDRQVINYGSKDYKRSVYLEVASSESEASCGAPPKDKSYDESLICGEKVELFSHDNDVKSANFKLNDTYFHIITRGLDEKELVSVVESLMQ